ncbi:Glycerophosphocholine phosphodiesterase [Coemansia sp. RSA 552]|nr:Glycerophosphocholine phosphodiesterase [Coemansia sp. RSA 552]
MSVSSFDQHRLGPRFYRVEFERTVAMRSLALQAYPVNVDMVSKDIVDAVNGAVKAATEYSTELAYTARLVSGKVAAVDAMKSAQSLGQVVDVLEDLEQRVQNVIRYGWVIKREWSEYVHDRTLIPEGFIESLGTGQAQLGAALRRAREKLALAESRETDEGAAGGWSAECVLTAAKMQRARARSARTEIRGAAVGAADVRQRNALHYAATGEVAWLRRLSLADIQEVRRQVGGGRQPALAAQDVGGDSPLTLAARAGNDSAVRYIVEESGVDVASASLVAAALAGSAAGYSASVAAVVTRLAAFPDSAAAVARMAVFYGLDGLFDGLCAALRTAGARALMSAEVALSAVTQRNGGNALLHIAALNAQTDMVRRVLRQDVFHAPEFDATTRNNAGLTALDMANYAGHRAFADELFIAMDEREPHVYGGLSDEAPALHVSPKDIVAGVADAAAHPAPPGTSAIFVSLGANNALRNARVPPLAVDEPAIQAALDALRLPRTSHLLLRIDAIQGPGQDVTQGADPAAYAIDVSGLLDAPVETMNHWHVPALFHTARPDKLVLRLALVSLADPRQTIAQAVLTVPPNYMPEHSEDEHGNCLPLSLTGGHYLQTTFVSSATGAVVGQAGLEIIVATPYHYHAESDEPEELDEPEASLAELSLADPGSWLCSGQTTIYGHRGSGMNNPRASPLQLGENTILSMQHAARAGVAAVEFDVQLTRDMAPIIYHDWTVAETGLNTPVNALTLAQFMALNPTNQLPNATRSCEDLRAQPSTVDSAITPHVTANSKNTVQGPFVTLYDLFETLPAHVGFDIEVKYPMPDEADDAGISGSFEINLFVDRILDVVFRYTGAPGSPRRSRRPIVFSSFHPDICLLLAHKVVGTIPIMFLTDASMSAMTDARCNSLDVAVRLCKNARLAGVVAHVGPVVQSPRIASLVRRNRLVLATYGDLNNQPADVLLQQAYGVDVVIADDVRAAVKTLARAR